MSEETYRLAAGKFTSREIAERLFLSGTYMSICHSVLGGHVPLADLVVLSLVVGSTNSSNAAMQE